MAAPTMPPARQTVKATAGQLLRLADELIRRGKPDEAEPIYGLLARDPDPDVRNEARYRTALLLKAKDQTQAAAVLLRQILDERPDAAAVRLQLATALQNLGDEEAALRELRAIRSANLPVGVARFVDRLSASLQASKPFGVQVEFALAPDSNINRATRSNSLGTIFGDFTVDEEAKAKSGLGAAVRTMAQVRRPMTDRLNLIARASGEANFYRHDKFNDIALELSVGGELKLGRMRLSAEAGLGQQWYGMEPYQRSFRLSGTVSRPIGSVSQLRLDASARWLDNNVNDLQDGGGLSARLYYERALSPRLFVSASIGADRFKAHDDAYSTKSWRVGATAYRDVGRMTVFAGVEFGGLKADERLMLLPEAREDRLRRVQLGAVYRQFTFAGFAPMTRLVFERNHSSVEFYDYQRTRTEFGVSRSF
ncbi:MAG: surface lipoprotein assembly modifier [Sphingomicrobium sp.]